jgi:hypothetical protein
MFHIKAVEKLERHIFCSIFFSENRAVYEILWKKLQWEQATDENVELVHCMLDT